MLPNTFTVCLFPRHPGLPSENFVMRSQTPPLTTQHFLLKLLWLFQSAFLSCFVYNTSFNSTLGAMVPKRKKPSGDDVDAAYAASDDSGVGNPSVTAADATAHQSSSTRPATLKKKRKIVQAGEDDDDLEPGPDPKPAPAHSQTPGTANKTKKPLILKHTKPKKTLVLKNTKRVPSIESRQDVAALAPTPKAVQLKESGRRTRGPKNRDGQLAKVEAIIKDAKIDEFVQPTGRWFSAETRGTYATMSRLRPYQFTPCVRDSY